MSPAARVLVPLPVVLPLVAAGLSLMLHRWRALQRAFGIAVCAAALAIAVALLVQVDREGILAVQVGGWPAPAGITFAVDRFSAIMLVISMAMVLAVLVYAVGQLDAERERLHFHPIYLVLAAGVSGSFVTGDLFNLFVAFEVMLTASYVLITLGGTSGQVRAGMTYVVISLLASTFFVVGVALVYEATGTVNMADLSLRLAELPAGVRTALGLLFLCVFGVKAAIFPLFFWLPDAYPTAPAPITALFAGLLTKVGVYAIIRTQTLLFGPEGGPSTVLLVIAGATMLVGVLGAIAQNDIQRILSFHIISQIGYMILGLALFTAAGIAGGIFYIVHHIVVKTALFLVGGMVQTVTGTARLSRLGGLARSMPLAAALFMLSALSLAGLPPFSGFVAKLALLQEGLALGRGTVVAVALVVSLLTLFSMTKIWAGAFWGAPSSTMLAGAAARGAAPAPAGGSGDRDPREAGGAAARGAAIGAARGAAIGAARGAAVGAGSAAAPRLRAPRLMMASTGAVVALSIAIALAAGPLYALAERAAADLVDPSAYIEAVLGR